MIRVGVWNRSAASMRSALIALAALLGGACPLAAVEPARVPGKDAASHPSPETPAPAAGTVEGGIFPKSFRIPGTETSVGIGGFVKLDYIQDFDAIGEAYEFKVNTIPTGAGETEGRTTIHARESRLHLELRSNTARGKFRAFVEGDFFGDKNAFRLRHAYGEFGHLLGGQTWTTFMDITARPQTLDFEGPDGEVFLRQALLRWSQPLSEKVKWAIALENPAPEIHLASGASGAARSNLPDVPAFVRFESTRGHAQIAALVRQIRYVGGAGESNATELGWGMNGSGKIQLGGRSEAMAQLYGGEGIAHYVESVTGQASDAAMDAALAVETLPLYGGVIGFTRHWSGALRAGLAYSTTVVETSSLQPGSAIERTQDARGNLIWSPVSLVDLGGEVLWGHLEHRDGSDGDAWRFQFAATYRLN